MNHTSMKGNLLMSWRFLFISLLIFAGLATWAGIQAGEWLIAHTPTTANIPNVSEFDPPPQVDQFGRPVLRQPQQPLMSGAQGVPEKPTAIDWAIDPSQKSDILTASSSQYNPNVTIGTASGSINAAPIQATPITRPATIPGTSGGGYAWEPAFHRAVAHCRTLGFFERPTCLGKVREQYCGAYNAWGKVKDCPER